MREAGAMERKGEIQSKAQRPIFSTSYFVFIALGLTLLTAWFRLWQLDTIPPGLWFDEAYNGMDAIWILKTKTWPVFLWGNNGREVMFHYLLALAIKILGETAYAIRLVSALLGILAVPLMYRWTLTMFEDHYNVAKAHWLGLVGAAGLVTSFWALTMNRAGYRANLLPIFMVAMSYFFWRGWQTGQMRYFLLAGAGLGLSQYTYLSARLLPLVFLLFVLGQTAFLWRSNPGKLKTVWLGLLLMGITSGLLALPLLLFFIDNPEAFWGRVSDVAVEVGWSTQALRALGLHLWQAVRVFVDGEDPNWRHHLLGRPVFDWFNTLGFWLGVGLTGWHYRRPANLYLLILLAVMWLPAPLSEPAFHTLRLAGILPAYYALVALGLVGLFEWIGRRSQYLLSLKQTLSPNWAGFYQGGFAALVGLLVFSGGLTVYDYFFRWSKMPEVYRAFDGQVVELASYLIGSESNVNLIIPFYLYTHASMRYLLHDNFTESVFLPEEVAADLQQEERVSVLIPEYPPADGKPPAWVWLSKDGLEQQGKAYVSAVNRDVSLARLTSSVPTELIEDGSGDDIARQYEVDVQQVLSLFPRQTTQKQVAVEWADNLRLTGYQFVPATVRTGEVSQLYLTWAILGHTGLQEKMFLQLLDARGNGVGQAEVEAISRKMYRWRDDGLILEQHSFPLDPDLETGLYFVRLGFFNPKTGQRLAVSGPHGQPRADEFIVGPLYVSANGLDPTQPQYPVTAMLGDQFELLGYSFYPIEAGNSTEIELFWKTHAFSGDIDYTVFLQVLDPQNQIIAQTDVQPLAGLYPTSRWEPGDILSEKFVLPVSSEAILSHNRLVTGMYDLATGTRLPVSQHGQLLSDGMIPLID